MKSYELFKVRGVSIRVHSTFLIFLAFLILAFSLSGGVKYAVAGAIYLIFIFSFVLIHELAHSMTAKRYRINTSSITLLPIGGVAKLDKYPRDPGAELRISLAGPMSNFLIGIGLFVLFLILNPVSISESLRGIPKILNFQNILIMAVQVNFALAFFNLLPAFPMDGGRVLRAVLAKKMGIIKATEKAYSIATVISILMFIAGFFFNPILIFIAIFVYFSGFQELRSIRLMESLRGIKVSEIMHEAYEVSPDTPLTNLWGIPSDFVVIENGIPIGVVRWMDIEKGLRSGKRSCKEVMIEEISVISPEDELGEVLPAIRPVAVVYESGIVYGVVDESDVMRALQYLSWKRFFHNFFRFTRF